jgi:predicted enzyme related to lactoylglutathione lyase
MTSQLVWFELPVPDVDRSRRFFGELMGWGFESRFSLYEVA